MIELDHMNKKLQYTRDSSGSCQVNGLGSEGKGYPGLNYEFVAAQHEQVV